MKTLSTNVAIAKVRAIYASLAARPLERQCVNRAQCCHFKLTVLTPYLTKGEALVVAKGWRATGRKEFRETPEGSCPMLDTA
ncbi:MAG: YkgJ family cysteine cluster protein, partial [Chthoniobacterales bacterium]